MSTPTPTESPRLHGARARAGMLALVERLRQEGIAARLHGHPVASPPDRDSLIAAVLSFAAAVLGWLWPTAGVIAALLAVLAAAAVGFGWWTPWPRRSAWTVIAGNPQAPVKHVVALALDGRSPRPWLSGIAGGVAGLAALLPGNVAVVALGGLLVALAAYDRDDARAIAIEEARAWIIARASRADTLVLVSTGVAGFGEGVHAVVDWYGIEPAGLTIEVQETRSGAAERRLASRGIGRPAGREADDVVVRGSVRG